jgi:large subunit ribosomal protein L15
MKLDELVPNEGARKRRKRVGRGIAAGQGKTSGRGTKGQSSRTGEGGHLYRQGGGLPFFRRLPFMRGVGFTPPNQIDYNEVNVGQLGRFPAGSEVTPESLAQARLLHKNSLPVALLANGEVSVPLTIRVHRVSEAARQKIEAAGGSIEILAGEERA